MKVTTRIAVGWFLACALLLVEAASSAEPQRTRAKQPRLTRGTQGLVPTYRIWAAEMVDSPVPREVEPPSRGKVSAIAQVADMRADDLVFPEPTGGLAPLSLYVLPEWNILHTHGGHLDEETVEESPINIGQRKPGAPLPPLTARTSSGEEVLLNDLWKKKPTVISLYKSSYCGHCQWQFMQLLNVHKELEALGYQVMAISHIAEQGVERMEDRYSPPFPLFSDEGQKVGRTLGIAFGKDRPEVNFYPGRNDMGVYGSALFIVDTDGRVQYEWTYSDNKTRLGTGPVLAAAKRVIEEKTSVFTHLAKATKTPETVTHLRLNYQRLTELPVDVLQLTNLVRLELVGNRLKTLPAGISALRNLQRLDLSSNELEFLPAEIGKLENLFELHLLYNELKTLPKEIGQLKELRFIHLAENQLESLPVEFAQLNLSGYSGCEGLYLWKNRLRQLPPEIAKMSLVYLYLDYNEFETLPAELFGNPNLTRVYINHNRLETVPAIDMQKLADIAFRHNKLKAIPTLLGDKPLNSLDLEFNQITQLDLGHTQKTIRNLKLAGNRIRTVNVVPDNVESLDLWQNPLEPDSRRILSEAWETKKGRFRWMR